MMGHFRVVAVIAVVLMALGGCANQTSPEPRNTAATPEATRSGAPAAERTAGQGGREAGSMKGLVTRAYTRGDELQITVEKEPLCRTIRESRRGPCPGIELKISDRTRVLRGPGGDARAAASDVEEGQRVHAFHGDTKVGPYYPYGEANKIVILGTR